MKTRKWAVVALLVIAVVALGTYRFFFDMNALPEGELLAGYPSPTGTRRVDVYLCNGGMTTDYAVRGAVVDARTGRSKTIYWQYHQSDASVVWINEETVIISGAVLGEEHDIVLDVTKDKYDYRHAR